MTDTAKPFQIPAGQPGPKEIDNRIGQAKRILAARRVKLGPDALRTQLQVSMLTKLLLARGLASDDELAYFFGLAQMEMLEQAVLDTTPAPKIVLPGRDS